MDNALLQIIADKKEQLIGLDAKKEKRNALVVELALLDKEIAETDEVKICNDVRELTGYAVKLGFIEPEVTEENSQCNDCEVV